MSSAQNHPANGSLWSQTRSSPWETSGPSRARFPISRRSPLYSGGLAVKNLPAVQETLVQSLGLEHPPEEGKVTHFSILAWRIPWTEGPGGLPSMGLQSRTQPRLRRSGPPVSSSAHCRHSSRGCVKCESFPLRPLRKVCAHFPSHLPVPSPGHPASSAAACPSRPPTAPPGSV